MDSHNDNCEKTDVPVPSSIYQTPMKEHESHSCSDVHSGEEISVNKDVVNCCAHDDHSKIEQFFSDDTGCNVLISENFSNQPHMPNACVTKEDKIEEVDRPEHVNKCSLDESLYVEQTSDITISFNNQLYNSDNPSDEVITGGINAGIDVQEVNACVQHQSEMSSTQSVTPVTHPGLIFFSCSSDKSFPTAIVTNENEEIVDNFDDSAHLCHSISPSQEISNDTKHISRQVMKTIDIEESNHEDNLTSASADEIPAHDADRVAAFSVKNDECESLVSCDETTKVVSFVIDNRDDPTDMTTEIKIDVPQNCDLHGQRNVKENQETTPAFTAISDESCLLFPKGSHTSPSLSVVCQTGDPDKLHFDTGGDLKATPERVSCVEMVTSSDKEDGIETQQNILQVYDPDRTVVSENVDMSSNPLNPSFNVLLQPQVGKEMEAKDAEVLNENQEPVNSFDSGWRAQNCSSNFHLVSYSDSEDSSSSESISSLSDDSDGDNDVKADQENEEEADHEIEEETHHEIDGETEHEIEAALDERYDKKEKTNVTQSSMNTRLRANGEVFPEELPPIDYLTISDFGEIDLVQLGTVSGIVDIMVVIKAMEATPALSDDSVLFLENGKLLGLIFETFGTVDQPFYTVRFNSAEDIKEKDIHIGSKIFYAPKADNLTKYIFISELRKMKCDDASWEHDNEPPAGALEFSDDEEERKAKKKPSSRKRRLPGVRLPGQTRRPGSTDGKSTDLKQGDLSRNSSGNQAQNHGTKPYSKWLPHETGQQEQALRGGDLTRNPFGNQTQKYGTKPFSKWPPHEKGINGEQNKPSGHSFRPSFVPTPKIFSQNGGMNNQPNVSFGGKPAWLNQPGMMGPGPPIRGSPRNFNLPNVSGNTFSFQASSQNSNTGWQGFNMTLGNRPPQQQPRCPLPDLTRPPPLFMPDLTRPPPPTPFLPPPAVNPARPPPPPSPLPPSQLNRI